MDAYSALVMAGSQPSRAQGGHINRLTNHVQRNDICIRHSKLWVINVNVSVDVDTHRPILSSGRLAPAGWARRFAKMLFPKLNFRTLYRALFSVVAFGTAQVDPCLASEPVRIHVLLDRKSETLNKSPHFARNRRATAKLSRRYAPTSSWETAFAVFQDGVHVLLATAGHGWAKPGDSIEFESAHGQKPMGTTIQETFDFRRTHERPNDPTAFDAGLVVVAIPKRLHIAPIEVSRTSQARANVRTFHEWCRPQPEKGPREYDIVLERLNNSSKGPSFCAIGYPRLSEAASDEFRKTPLSSLVAPELLRTWQPTKVAACGDILRLPTSDSWLPEAVTNPETSIFTIPALSGASGSPIIDLKSGAAVGILTGVFSEIGYRHSRNQTPTPISSGTRIDSLLRRLPDKLTYMSETIARLTEGWIKTSGAL